MIAYIVSIASIIGLWLMGNKWKYAPMFNIGVQGLWYVYAIYEEQWGLMLGITGYTFVHIRNAVKWMRGVKNGI